MMKYIIIDDNQKDLDSLVSILESTKKLKYYNIYTSLQQLKQDYVNIPFEIEIVFIKAKVFGTCGIGIAKKLKDMLPHVQFVFISRRKEYAVEAFELGAVDYILQPFQEERIYKTINRLMVKESPPFKKSAIKCVCLFKYLHFKNYADEVVPVKWRTAKTKELFAFLMTNRNELMVRKDVLIELLWPEEDVHKAYESLYSTIYQIRKLLRDIGANIEITSRDNAYEVDLNGISCDVDQWIEGIKGIDQISEADLPKIFSLVEQYTGDYLEDEMYIWMENQQDCLRMLYQSFTDRVLRYLIERESYTKATLLALRNQRLNPYLPDSYFFLMKIYDRLGDYYQVEKQYAKLVDMFEIDFNTPPPKYIQDWYREWIEQHVGASEYK